MKSKFISAEKLKLYNTYSRSDVGYGRTQTALMQINQHEKIGFFNIGEKYDNGLKKNEFILNPRDDLNNEQLLDELNNCTTYLFLRKGIIGPYFYMGTSNYVKRHNSKHVFFKLNNAPVPEEIMDKLNKQ